MRLLCAYSSDWFAFCLHDARSKVGNGDSRAKQTGITVIATNRDTAISFEVGRICILQIHGALESGSIVRRPAIRNGLVEMKKDAELLDPSI